VETGREKKDRCSLQSNQFSRGAGDDPEGGVLKDVAFNRHSMNDGHHVSPYDNGKVQVGADGIIVKLVQGIDEENFRRTLSKATRATIGIDLTGLDEDNRDWEEMLQGGLQTALESQVIVFEVQGVSRACTHQLVRTRKAAFHQQSMRASFYGATPETRIPESVFMSPRARRAFMDALNQSQAAYRIACEEDISYQDARYILPEGTNNYIMLEYPVREFLNVYAYRACSMFQWEIVSVMRKCREVLIEAHPWMEPYVKISCEKTKESLDGGKYLDELGMDIAEPPPEAFSHHCTFQGWEEVDEQCDFPWARETNRQFKSKAHVIKKKGSDR
jgi:flavin-dependent thymidylate synthase